MNLKVEKQVKVSLVARNSKLLRQASRTAAGLDMSFKQSQIL